MNRICALLFTVLCLVPAWLEADGDTAAWSQRYASLAPATFSETIVTADNANNLFVAASLGAEIQLLKYSSSGALLWTNRHDSAGLDRPVAITTDSGGNVILLGQGSEEIVTIKYSGSGALVWTNCYATEQPDEWPTSLAVDSSGNVFAGARINNEPQVIKYSFVGVPLWTNRFSLFNSLRTEIALDADGNMIIGGSASVNQHDSYALLKCSGAGIPIWTNFYHSTATSDDELSEIAVDHNRNIFVTGTSSSGGFSHDCITLKYSADGMPLWTNWYDGPDGLSEFPIGIVVDMDGNAHVGAKSGSNSTFYDYAVVKYSGLGLPLWTNRFASPGYTEDTPSSLAADPNGRVCLTGTTPNGYATVTYSSSGTLLWTKILPGPTLSHPDVIADGAGGFVVTGSSGSLFTQKYFSTSGAIAWTNLHAGWLHVSEIANAVTVSSEGTVFVTGSSNGDFLTIAYSATGTPLWTNIFTGPGRNFDGAISAASDMNGNVVVTGSSSRTTDSSSVDYATVKYSGTGVPVWTNRYNGQIDNVDQPVAVAIDGVGNVFVTGHSHGGVALADYATINYSAAGVPLWTNRYSGPANRADQPAGLVVDGSGNVIVTGYSTGVSSSADYATLKYSNSGVPQWTNRYNGPGNSVDQASAVATDSSGNVFVTGFSHSSSASSSADYATIKYSAGGVPLWTNRYNSAANKVDQAVALAVDRDGSVVVTGSSYFPGLASLADFATIKYSANGIPLWTNLYNGPANRADSAAGIAVDPAGNVFVTGSSVTISTNLDFATILYSSAGIPLSTNRYNGPANGPDIPSGKSSIALTPDGGVVITGGSDGADSTATIYDYFTVKYTVATPITIRAVRMAGGTFSASFTSSSGNSFIVLTTTNLNTPPQEWTVSGSAIEESPGVYRFTEPAVSLQRFYRIQSP